MRPLRRLLAVAMALAAALPATAGAHATVVSTSPISGAALNTEPAQVVFTYDEPVEGTFGAVRAYDAQGNRVDQGDAFHPNGSGKRLAVHLRPNLPRGTYTVTYRVVSADSHIVSGGFVFSIGPVGAAPGRSVASLLSAQRTGAATQIAFGIARAVEFGAIGVGVGALVFLLLIWTRALATVAGADRRWAEASVVFVHRLRLLLLVAALLGAGGALAGVDLEAAEAAGVSGWSALRPHLLREVLHTRFGVAWTVGAAAWVLLGALVAGALTSAARAPVLRPASVGATGLAMPRPSPLLASALVPAALLVALPSFAGHGATQHPVGVLFPSIVVHVAAMSVWLGGLVVLLLVLPAATRRLEPGDRTRLLAAVLERFSLLALVSVGVLLATGVLQGFEEVRHWGLLTSTAFGRCVLIKFGLLLALIVLGAVNRQRTVPRLRQAAAGGASPGATGLVLRRTLRAEVALIVVVLGVTGALASYAPAVTVASGPFNGTAALGPEQLQIVVDPAKVGANAIHLYLLDARTGGQFTQTKQLTVTATETKRGIGPLALRADHTGPGHYTVAGALLNVPGTWTIAVTARVSEFDEYTAKVQVPVR